MFYCNFFIFLFFLIFNGDSNASHEISDLDFMDLYCSDDETNPEEYSSGDFNVDMNTLFRIFNESPSIEEIKEIEKEEEDSCDTAMSYDDDIDIESFYSKECLFDNNKNHLHVYAKFDSYKKCKEFLTIPGNHIFVDMKDGLGKTPEDYATTKKMKEFFEIARIYCQTVQNAILKRE